MGATILILLFVHDELSFDKYHEKSDRIVRVTRAWVNQDGETSLHLGNVAPPFSPLLENDFEDIIHDYRKQLYVLLPIVQAIKKNVRWEMIGSTSIREVTIKGKTVFMGCMGGRMAPGSVKIFYHHKYTVPNSLLCKI